MPLTPTTTVGPLPTNSYFPYDRFINRYGLENVMRASNKDQTQQVGSSANPIPKGQINAYAVQDAFNSATDDFHRRMYGGVLRVPLDFSPNLNVVPSDIAEIVMHMAWCKLYGTRGLEAKGKNQKSNQFVEELNACYDKIAAMRAGEFQVPEAMQAANRTMTAVTYQDVRKERSLLGNPDSSPVLRWGW